MENVANMSKRAIRTRIRDLFLDADYCQYMRGMVEREALDMMRRGFDHETAQHEAEQLVAMRCWQGANRRERKDDWGAVAQMRFCGEVLEVHGVGALR